MLLEVSGRFILVYGGITYILYFRVGWSLILLSVLTQGETHNARDLEETLLTPGRGSDGIWYPRHILVPSDLKSR